MFCLTAKGWEPLVWYNRQRGFSGVVKVITDLRYMLLTLWMSQIMFIQQAVTFTLRCARLVSNQVEMSQWPGFVRFNSAVQTVNIRHEGERCDW